jgi:ornithine cyclodeaminase/alanine dehydrogenase-like protein (mu-crystallin family)
MPQLQQEALLQVACGLLTAMLAAPATALAQGVILPGHVRSSLDQIVAGLAPGRLSDDEIIVFDSTGVAIEDVAAAAVVYERAEGTGAGLVVA